ncbi:hypothetical protein NCG89_13215 [Spongiibacter taiwanensis]|uniref:hypothetical protein n=1 Tax=Spongiibacter taiwanensis TaxID=1748242 RepID=UPI002034FD8D|nr:hypothetical protein [Spongiibacter taiwanensis]USA42486.1 hypothetical protein NCG89_13215 [Spongiibacter taiwanensis]
MTYTAPELNEMSGLASSFVSDHLLWAHNDSGDSARLFRLNTNGEVLGQVNIRGASAFDWEDIASFKDANGNAFLLIADTGDNTGLRPFVDLYLLAEPGLDAAEAKTLRRYTVVYPDGPRDTEAVAIDAVERSVYLLSKRDDNPRLYRFSLDALKQLFVPLQYLGEVTSLPSKAKHADIKAKQRWQFQPTAMAFSPEHDAAIVVTPRHTYYFPRDGEDSWLTALNRDPVILNPGRFPQIEAGTFSRDGNTLYLGSEGSPARAVALPRPH